MNGLSVIIPVFNEIESIKETTSSLYEVLKKSGLDFEVILVDDGSTDGTRDFLIKNHMPEHVRVLYHKKNRGYGAALKTGIRDSKKDFVFIADCDGTYPIEKIPEFAKKLLDGNCDMIVGARTGKDAQIPVIRRPAKFIIQHLANYLTSEKIPDLNSGFRGIRKDVVLEFISLLPEGFSFTTTITIASLANGYAVEYVPISYKRRIGKSKIAPIRDTLNFFKLIIRTVLYFNPLKIFLPLTGFLLFLAAGVAAYSWATQPKVFDDTVVIILMAAFQVFAIGLIADLIDKRIKK